MSKLHAIVARSGLRRRARWTIAVVVLGVVLLAAANVVAQYVREAEVVTGGLDRRKAGEALQRTLDVAQLLADAAGYVDGFRRTGGFR